LWPPNAGGVNQLATVDIAPNTAPTPHENGDDGGHGEVARGIGKADWVVERVGIEVRAALCHARWVLTNESPEGRVVVTSPGLALDVAGKARFSTAGSASVAAGQNTAVVANPATTASSHISVTLVGDPGPRQLRWVERSPGVGFTVHFAGGPPGQRPQVPFTYLIVEPA
jgi:hypothetical protein